MGDPAGLAHYILLEQGGYFRGLSLGSMENGFTKTSIMQLNQMSSGRGFGAIDDPAAIRAIQKWSVTPQAAKWLDDNKELATLLAAGTVIFWKIAGPAIRTQINDMIKGYSRAQTKQAIFAASRRMRDRARARVASTASTDDLAGGAPLRGTQNATTAAATRTGRAYDRRVRRFWRQYEGKSVGGWNVAHVNRRLDKGIQPDLVLIDPANKRISIHDVTSKFDSGHAAKGQRYVNYFEKIIPDMM